MAYTVEYLVISTVYMIDFVRICKNNNTVADFSHGFAQTFATVVPIMFILRLLLLVEPYKKLREKPFIGDMLEGCILALLYNLIINFKQFNNNLICSTVGEKDISSVFTEKVYDIVRNKNQDDLKKTVVQKAEEPASINVVTIVLLLIAGLIILILAIYLLFTIANENTERV